MLESGLIVEDEVGVLKTGEGNIKLRKGRMGVWMGFGFRFFEMAFLEPSSLTTSEEAGKPHNNFVSLSNVSKEGRGER
jgi:hypothetical protein